MPPQVLHFFDYKSPYAYLAQEEAFRLATRSGVAMEWRPYTLDIPSFLGAARLDPSGRDTLRERNDHQWRRVHYAYMDCRREARRRGLTILGPRKIFDSSVAHIGMLYALERGRFRPYHDLAFERFFRRELDLGDPAAVTALLEEAKLDATDFPSYLAGAGRARHDEIQREAEAAGVFGVPSFLVEGELFWGCERLDRVRERIEQACA